MTRVQLQAAADSLERQINETQADNIELLQLLKSIPGGWDLMRRELEKLGMTEAQFNALLDGSLEPSALAPLLKASKRP